GSNGSVVPHFIDQIRRFNKVTVTDDTMTRYFLTLPEAIELLFQAAQFSVGGETYVMNMPSFYIIDLARVIIKHYGNKDTKIETIGLREGEKIHELLISEHESKNTYKYNQDYYAILPELKINRNYNHINIDDKVDFKTFSSADNIKDSDYLFNMLMKGDFLV
ncbi:MAG: polysaccharide biosynthesis protein, partial [bacterium]